ncbi:Oligosaccaryltransferase-domain-containing protein [Aspergillus ambiguus]|uniref:dolichyl-diphosphooligosaccharide--protein glycosyltransferase subunit 4 n=1 Tax=Aspergillus ambiguus TaxID=176160 RepID=UPI003CCDE52E
MITDDQLHRLAVFLGSCAMMLIVFYHFLEVNAKDDDAEDVPVAKKSASASAATASSNTTTAARS